MPYLAGYAAILVAVGVLDAVWLTSTAKLYKATLGDMMLSDFRYAPAIVFYLALPVGILIFGTLPGIRAGSVATALVMGGLFGGFAYATYDLTNYATLRNWTLQITIMDIAYGAVLGAVTAAAGFYAMRAVG